MSNINVFSSHSRINTRRMADEVDGGAVRHVTDDSFESWFATRMNRNRNEERHVTIGGNISLPDDKPGKFRFMN